MPQVKSRLANLLAAAAVVAGCLGLSAGARADDVKEKFAAVNTRITAADANANQAKDSAAVANGTAQAAQATALQANQRIDQLTAQLTSLEQRLSGTSATRTPRN